MAASVSNTYGGGGALRTQLGREGVDIGPVPDFWGDLNSIVGRLRPQGQGPARAQAQVQALRQPDYGESAPVMQQAPSPASTPWQGPDYSNYTARSFGHPSMSPQGVIGTYVNPLDVPLALHGQVPTGFFTDDSHSNYTYSPTVNPARYATSPNQRERS